MNASPYWKSIAMSRSSIAVPGTLEPNFNATPSSGWTRTTSWLWPSDSTSAGVERQVRRPLEQHRDLGDPSGHALAGPDVERHAGPAAVLDAELDRDVGLGGRVRRHVLLFEVADGALAGDPARQVLPADGARRRRPSGSVIALQHLELLGADLARRRSWSAPPSRPCASSCSRWFCSTSRAVPAVS